MWTAEKHWDYCLPWTWDSNPLTSTILVQRSNRQLSSYPANWALVASWAYDKLQIEIVYETPWYNRSSGRWSRLTLKKKCGISLLFATAILVKRATFERYGSFRTVVKNEKIVRTQMGTSVGQTNCQDEQCFTDFVSFLAFTAIREFYCYILGTCCEGKIERMNTDSSFYEFESGLGYSVWWAILIFLFLRFLGTVNIARSLECYKCNESWSATMCFKRSRIETCHYRPESVCMAVDASVTNLKGEKSIIFVRYDVTRIYLF